MKKLTAGIFTVLMGLVTVNAAEAAVASKGYVDEKVGGATTSIEALTQTVAANKTAAEKLVSDYKTENNAKVQANTDAIADNAAAIAVNTGLIGDNADAIAANTQAINNEKTARETAVSGLDERLVEVEKFSGEGEGSVAKQIADALSTANGYTDAEVKELADGAVAGNTAAIAAINNADTGILKQAQTYADGLATNYDASGSAAQALADAKTYADGLATNYDASGSAAQALADAKSYADGLATNYDAAGSADDALTAAKAYADAEDAKIEGTIGEVAAGKTVVGMIAEAQTAATYDDTALKARVSANETGIANNATEIAKKLTDTTTISADGKYVLTAVTVGDDTTYAWELIERSTDKK